MIRDINSLAICSRTRGNDWVVIWINSCLDRIGIVVGVIGSVVQDMTKVVEFITSHENLDKENPIIFGKDYSEYLDVCFNTGGDLAEKLGLKSSFKSIDNIVKVI